MSVQQAQATQATKQAQQTQQAEAPTKDPRVMATVQMSAAQGPQRVEVDREAAEAIMNAMAGQGDGRISKQDAKDILAEFTDGGVYARMEQPLVKMMLAACDDRKTVMLNGKRIRMSDATEAQFKHDIFSFFGTLGAKAKAKQAKMQSAPQAQQVKQAQQS